MHSVQEPLHGEDRFKTSTPNQNAEHNMLFKKKKKTCKIPLEINSETAIQQRSTGV